MPLLSSAAPSCSANARSGPSTSPASAYPDAQAVPTPLASAARAVLLNGALLLPPGGEPRAHADGGRSDEADHAPLAATLLRLLDDLLDDLVAPEPEAAL